MTAPYRIAFAGLRPLRDLGASSLKKGSIYQSNCPSVPPIADHLSVRKGRVFLALILVIRDVLPIPLKVAA
jgi:hypothetical protein